MTDVTHVSLPFFLTQGLGSSKKFADMMEAAIKNYASKHNLVLESIVKIPLEGEGSIDTRVDR
jgi:hypothetical protein